MAWMDEKKQRDFTMIPVKSFIYGLKPLLLFAHKGVSR
jgi:hypothetical protein